MTAVLSIRGSHRSSLRWSKGPGARTSTDLRRRLKRLVPENGGTRIATGIVSPAGDTASFAIAERAIEIVTGIALASIEHEQCLACRACFFFESCHQGAGDTLPSPLRMHQQLGDLPPVRAVLALRGLELYRPHDAGVSLRHDQNHSLSRDPYPPAMGYFRG